MCAGYRDCGDRANEFRPKFLLKAADRRFAAALSFALNSAQAMAGERKSGRIDCLSKGVIADQPCHARCFGGQLRCTFLNNREMRIQRLRAAANFNAFEMSASYLMKKEAKFFEFVSFFRNSSNSLKITANLFSSSV